jgi:nucleotide-binding universal stress UspA family protein
MGGTIICGVSDSDGSRVAARLAAALAARLGLRLVLVHVVVEGTTLPHDAIERRVRAERALEAIVGELGGVEARIVVGSRVDEIARVAAEEGADAIVVGSRSHGARGRQLRCSLVHDLEAATAVPVMIAPPATRARNPRRLALATAPVR